MSLFILLPIILVISLVLTMVGLGGGLIFSPLFILLSFPVQEAVSASLFLNGIAALSAAITYFHHKMVDIRLAIPLIVTSSLAAPLGALTSARVDMRIFTIALAGIIFLAAVRMLLPGQPGVDGAGIGTWRKVIGSAIIGGVIGFSGGLFGIGGGVFIVPLLIFILRVPTKIAAATSIFIVTFSSFSGFLTHVAVSEVNWGFILLAACFSFAGGQIGSRVMVQKLKGATVKRIFGLVLLIFVFKLLQRVL